MNPSKGTEEDNSLNPEASFWCQVMLLDLKYTRPLNVRKGFQFGVSFAMSHVYIKREATFRQMFGILTERMFPSARLEQIADQKAAVGAGWRPRTKTSIEESDHQNFHDLQFPWLKKKRESGGKEQRYTRDMANNIKTKNLNLLFVHQHTPSKSTAHDCCAFSTSDMKCPYVLCAVDKHWAQSERR